MDSRASATLRMMGLLMAVALIFGEEIRTGLPATQVWFPLA